MKNRNLPLKIAALCFLLSAGSAHAQDFKTLIERQLSAKQDFMKPGLKTFEIINEDRSSSMKGDVVKFQQSYEGIPVYNATGTALIRNTTVAYLEENFARNYTSAQRPAQAGTGSKIFSSAAAALGLKNPAQYKLTDIHASDVEAAAPVRHRLVYFATENNDLRLCYEFIFEEKGTSNYWDVLADAATGELVKKDNLTVSCSFHHGAFSHDYSEHLPQGFERDFTATDMNAIGAAAAPSPASYRVFPLPVESPNHGSRALVSNPWFLDASPDGWHQAGGGSYSGNWTITRGNNVHAYEDKAGTNTPGTSPDGGADRIFDFPFVVNATNANLPAATTNLFYINNKIHDIFYRLGFTETARNFQAFNYGKGGSQNDYVMAEAHDGGGTNNANFSTPSDGARPRMQMYLWDPAVIERVFYNAPAEAVGRVVSSVVSTTFGPQLTPTGVTADVKLSPVLDGCTPLPVQSLAGKIGLIRRGDCNFSEKVKNAQVAGAVAAIIYSLPDSTPTGGMAGDDATITIPSVLIENSEGIYMKGLLDANKAVNITLKYDPDMQPTRDGSFDNGIVVHEYGHGISNRNTGNGFSCLSSSNSAEQMGEGWSDFFALMLTNRPNDNRNVPRGIGTYATTEAIAGGGIRPARYSPDRAINPYTYRNTNGMQYTNANGQVVTDVHSVGFVWATMLWDLHWKYVEKYGYSSDVMANATNGSTRVLQLVVDGLKLQACSPTFIDGRNAILQAELNTTGGEDRCMIWDTFAKRGLGVNASAGIKTNINDQVEDFTVPADCSELATNEAGSKGSTISLYPNPAKNEFFIKSAKNVVGKVNVTIYDVSGKLVSNQKIAASEAVNTQSLANGIYVVKVDGLGIQYSSKLMIKK